jgi:hypothetical protein
VHHECVPVEWPRGAPKFPVVPKGNDTLVLSLHAPHAAHGGPAETLYATVLDLNDFTPLASGVLEEEYDLFRQATLGDALTINLHSDKSPVCPSLQPVRGCHGFAAAA